MVKPHGLNRAPGLKVETSVGQFFKFYDEIMYKNKGDFFLKIIYYNLILNILFTLGLHTEIIEK